MTRARMPATLLMASLGLAACAGPGILIGAGATVGVAAVSERGVVNAAEDTRIGLQVNSALLQKKDKLFGETIVDVVEGRVMLTGILDSEAAREEAERLTWTVAGVKEVLNEIQVGPARSLGEYARDKRIGTELRAQLIADRRIDDVNYTTVTIRGVVYLLGIAKDEAELDRVVQHVRTIPGVRDVVNHVMLRDDPRRHA
ncbi:MAG TPA: BON domain-containing protein [Candidatus Sulfotelmatobacter sp.]|nr:BON domain-containing protein [Candidatus Sulfotelmatobacter sp.]